MKLRDALIAWTPHGGVKVGPIKDKAWSHPYSHSAGAPFAEAHERRGMATKLRVLLDFHTVVVRDGVDVTEAHREFLQIEEYRNAISADCPGLPPFLEFGVTITPQPLK